MKNINICFAIIMISCGGTSQEQSETASVSDSNSDMGDQSCLSEITDPEKWYSVTSLASLVNQPAESIKQEAQPKYNSCQFNWRNERKHMMKAGKIEMEVPTNNVVAITIKNLDEAIEKANQMHKREFTYEEYFDSYHTLPDEEEQKKIDEAIDEKAKEDEKMNTAKSLLAMAKTEDFAQVDNLGDKANKYVQTAPGLRETRLAILHGNVVIMINVDISDDDSEDLAAAEEVAAAVIGLCN